MKRSHNPIDSYDKYLAEAMGCFQKHQTNEGLVSLTMALQEMGTLLHDIQGRLNVADGYEK
jgi:hypothetical protein